MELVVHRYGIDFRFSWRTIQGVDCLYDFDKRIHWTNDAHEYMTSFQNK